MHFTNVLVFGLAMIAPVLGTPIEKRDGCHNSNDSIGKTCTFKDYPSFNYAASLYCAEFALGVNVPQGNSYGIKIASVPDGYGGQQIFWGNYRIDRGGNHLITYNECLTYMEGIFNRGCKGYGGWVNTSFGTVFGECIRQ